jgi:hypothetical protein
MDQVVEVRAVGGAERRKYRRIEFQAPAFIEHNNRTTFGEIRNVSNLGAFLKTDGKFSVNDSVQLSIYFLEGSATLSVTIPGTVARLADGGVGLFSPHLDVYKLLHLEHLLAFHKGNPQRLTDEFYEYVLASQNETTPNS